jgi:hypothetical protein
MKLGNARHETLHIWAEEILGCSQNLFEEMVRRREHNEDANDGYYSRFRQHYCDAVSFQVRDARQVQKSNDRDLYAKPLKEWQGDQTAYGAGN